MERYERLMNLPTMHSAQRRKPPFVKIFSEDCCFKIQSNRRVFNDLSIYFSVNMLLITCR